MCVIKETGKPRLCASQRRSLVRQVRQRNNSCQGKTILVDNPADDSEPATQNISMLMVHTSYVAAATSETLEKRRVRSSCSAFDNRDLVEWDPTWTISPASMWFIFLPSLRWILVKATTHIYRRKVLTGVHSPHHTAANVQIPAHSFSSL